MTKLVSRFIAVLVLTHAGSAFPQTSLWQAVTPQARTSTDTSTTRYFDSDDQALRNVLNLVPGELSGQSATIDLPMPDGSLATFSIVESSIMEAGLAAKFPQIKTYKVYGVDDPIASGRVDINDNGFHAMLQTSQGRIFIDPDRGSSSAYRYLARTRDANQASEPFYCSAGELEANHSSGSVMSNRTANRIPSRLLTYRLAVSATQEYATVFGGTKSSVMSEITTAINRVNQIYELDLGIRLILAANNDSLIDVAGTSPLAGFNGSGLALISLNKSWIDSNIGVGSYDIGHVFSTGGGGIARLASACNNLSKAEGVTGLPSPVGDPFYIDFVSHEIGHQFGAAHTFNGSTDFCNGQRNAPTAVEPGSGTTIMGYAGICGAENIQLNSDATFHAASIVEIDTYVTSGAGSGCGTIFSIANADPTANAGLDRNIPVNTAFLLEGLGTDINGDTLSYQWDQMDNNGTQTTSLNLGSDFGDNPLFRTFVPQCATGRNFPDLVDQRTNTPDPAETLPTTARNLNFRLTVRDSRTGQATDDVRLTVDNTSGPFQITSHTTGSTMLQSNNTETITWDVANTTNATVNCQSVDIDLLTFSGDGFTYSITSLVSSTPNDGTQNIPIPGESNSQARFRLKCSDNIFYDISDADLNFNPGGTVPFDTAQFSTKFSTVNTCNTGSVVAGDQVGGGATGGGGGGNFAVFGTDNNISDYLWLIFLSSLLCRVTLKRFYPTRF